MMKYENEYGRECVIIFNVVRFYYCVHKILYSPNEIIQSNYLKCSSSINFETGVSLLHVMSLILKLPS